MFVEKILKRNRLPRQQYKYALVTLSAWFVLMCGIVNYTKMLTEQSGARVPKILHKTTRTLGGKDIQTSFYNECEDMYTNDGWDVKLWYDFDIDLFVQGEYPQYYKRFKEITPYIKQVDAVRFLFMHHFGGIYTDMDSECIRPAGAFVDGLVKGNTFWMTGYPESQFMMSTKGNKFALFAFEKILRDWTRFNVRSTGGPQGLHRMAKEYVSTHGQDSIRPFVMYDQSECDRIQPPGDVVCGVPTHRWIEPLDKFPRSNLRVEDKIGFIPSNLFDPTACLARIGHCKTSHCHGRDDVKGALAVHHCLFSWKDQASG